MSRYLRFPRPLWAVAWLVLTISLSPPMAGAGIVIDRLIYGDIETDLVSVSSYNIVTGEMEGIIDWGALTGIPTGTVFITQNMDGSATVVAGMTPFTLPDPFTPPGGNWSYRASNARLSAAGAQANIKIIMPEGIIFKRHINDALYREGDIDIGFQSITQEQAVAPLFLTNGTIARVKAENEPFEVGFAQMSFTDADGMLALNPSFHYLHTVEFVTDARVRDANDGFLHYGDFDGSVFVKPGGLQCTITGLNASFEPAFPAGFHVTLPSFTLTYANNRVASGALNVSGTILHYTQDLCSGEGIPLESFGTFTFEVGRDGALFADLDRNGAAINIEFDAYEVGPVTADGTLYFPGWRAAHGGGNPFMSNYLIAGRQSVSDSASSIVLHGEEDYVMGEGSYGGWNVEFGDLTGVPFSTVLACEEAAFVCSNANKFYLRFGGFSGTLDASDASVKSLPPLNLYGEYETTLTRYNITLLDNQQHLDSAIDGTIDLPFPSDTEISFTKMQIDACGSPGEAQIADVSNNVLAYWNREFDFKSLAFEPVLDKNDEPIITSCGSEKRTLWTTSSNPIPQLDRKLLVETNFAGNGSILGNNTVGEVKATLQDYNFDVRRAYYSKWDGSMGINGKTIIAGDIKLPFWGLTPVVAFWDSGSIPNLFNGREYAQSPPGDPDPDRNGFPAGITTLLQYQAAEAHRPLVEASFAKIIPLEYPVSYNNLTQRFETKSGEEKMRNLVIVEVSSNVSYITRDETELRFGLGYSGLPQINLSTLLETAAGPAVEQLLMPIKNGMKDVNAALSGNLANTLRGQVANLTRPKVTQMVNQLKAAAQGIDGAVPQADLNMIINAQLNGLNDTLFDLLNEESGPLVGVIDRTLDGLEAVDTALDALNATQVADVLVELISLTGADTSGVEQVLGDVEAARAYIRENIIEAELRPRLEQLRSELTGNGNLLTLQNLVAGPDFATLTSNVDQKLKQYTNARRDVGAKIRNLDAEEVNQLLVDTLFNSILFQKVQQEVAKIFEPLKTQIQGVLNGFFDAINNQIKAYLEQVGAAINKLTQKFNDVVGVSGAEMNGYAVFSNDSLDRLHIDAEFGLTAPEKFTFRGSLDMERFKNDTDGVVCGTPAGFESIRTKIAVYDIPMNFGRGDLRAKEIALYLRLNQNMAEEFFLSDVAGKLETTGSLDFEAVKVIAPLFRAGVGQNETYIAFKGKVVFNAVAMQGGIFLGKTCSGIEILQEIDPEVGDVITQNEITGIYAFAEAAIPIINYGCFLRIGATAGAGFWYFVEGPTYGGKMTAGVYGQGLCLISVRGKLILVGGKEGKDFFFKGTGWIAGGLGFCEPEEWFTLADVWADKWCYTCALMASVTYRNGWSVDYDAECE